MLADENVELAEILDEVRRIEVLSKRLVTNVISGGYSSVFRGAGVEFSEVREYVDGDDPRTVDWNVTARLGRPFVKKYVDERELTVVFLLDLSPSMGGGFGLWSARRTAARLCACLALSAVRNGDKVGLVAFAEDVEHFLAPAKGMGHALRLVRDCLALRSQATTTSFNSVLEFVGRILPRHAVVFLISDFLSDGWQQAAARCSLRHDLIAIRILPSELKALPKGLMRLCELEGTGRGLVDWNDLNVRHNYATDVAAWRLATEETLRRTKIDLLDVNIPREPTNEAVSRPILRFFRMREERGAKR